MTDPPVGIPRNLAPRPKPFVTTPSSFRGYGVSGESGPTIDGRFSLDAGAMVCNGGAGGGEVEVDGDAIINLAVDVPRGFKWDMRERMKEKRTEGYGLGVEEGGEVRTCVSHFADCSNLGQQRSWQCRQLLTFSLLSPPGHWKHQMHVASSSRLVVTGLKRSVGIDRKPSCFRCRYSTAPARITLSTPSPLVRTIGKPSPSGLEDDFAVYPNFFSLDETRELLSGALWKLDRADPVRKRRRRGGTLAVGVSTTNEGQYSGGPAGPLQDLFTGEYGFQEVSVFPLPLTAECRNGLG